jgi:hypothetical protein
MRGLAISFMAAAALDHPKIEHHTISAGAQGPWRRFTDRT